MRSIEEIHAGREFITAKDLRECFEVKTGLRIGLNTIAAYRAMKMPGAFHPPGSRLWLYEWGPVWEWYRTYTERKVSKRNLA